MKYCIAEKRLNHIDIISCEQTLDEQIAAHIFPYGSQWRAYKGYRAFKLVALSRGKYLLSYTLVIDTSSILLRSWGIVGDTQEILRTLIPAPGIVELFREFALHFKQDPLFEIMEAKLYRDRPGPLKEVGCSWWLLWIWQLFGGKLVIRISEGENNTFSLTEDAVWSFVRSNLWKGKLFSRLPTFCTFSLSAREPVQIIAMPELYVQGK